MEHYPDPHSGFSSLNAQMKRENEIDRLAEIKFEELRDKLATDKGAEYFLRNAINDDGEFLKSLIQAWATKNGKMPGSLIHARVREYAEFLAEEGL